LRSGGIPEIEGSSGGIAVWLQPIADIPAIATTVFKAFRRLVLLRTSGLRGMFNSLLGNLPKVADALGSWEQAGYCFAGIAAAKSQRSTL